jgi:hypothetical protein
MPSSPSLSAGWTDDLSIRVAPDCTLDELVDAILAGEAAQEPHSALLETLTRRFALSYPDARLALDRVEGGRVRASTSTPENMPDPGKDPVAFIAYQRARGQAPPPPRRTSTAWDALVTELTGSRRVATAQALAERPAALAAMTPHEREAASSWRDAVRAIGATRPMSSVRAVERLLVLAELTVGSDAGPNARANILVQAGTALSLLIEDTIQSLGVRRHAPDGTDAWFDAVALAEASARLADLFARVDDTENEHRAWSLHGRITTRTLGHCYERVGAAMLASAACAQRLGDVESAVGYCDALIVDFAVVVIERWESSSEAPFDEHLLALAQLARAIELRAALTGRTDPDVLELDARCQALIDRARAEPCVAGDGDGGS